MLKALTSLLLAVLAVCAFAQVADLTTANQMAAQVVDIFNKDDAPGMISITTPEFRKGISDAQFKGLVDQVHSLGVLSNPLLILDLGEQRQYKVAVKKEGKPDSFILLTLGVESAAKCFNIGLARYKEPTPRTKPFPTDNAHKTAQDKNIQAAVDRYIAQNNSVGISIAVVQDGHESFYNYGETAIGNEFLPTNQTIYEIGSITKTMTGILLAQAVNDHKLSLDDDIRKHLPGTYPNLEFQGKPIEIRHLATHTSGLPGNPPGIPDDGKADAYERYSHAQLLKDLATIKLTRASGDVFSYSNMGGGLCGLILQNAYNMAYEKLLQKYIFAPAKMKHTGITLTPDMDRHYATPHDANGVKTDRWIVNGIESAGAVRSNAEDMLKYARFNLDERNPDVALSHTLLSTPDVPAAGIFWSRADSRSGGLYYAHEGSTGGFTTYILVMPTSKLAVVVLTNSGEQKPNNLAYEIALSLLNEAGNRRS